MTVPVLDREELAYLAGVLDSDGYITIRRHSTNPLYPGSRTFSEQVGVGQTHPAAVEMFAARWGGLVHLRTRTTPGDWKPIYYWTLNCAMAARAVADLRPWLRVKAVQADLLLALRTSKGLPRATTRPRARGPLDPAIAAERRALFDTIRGLNDRRHTRIAS